MFRKKSIVFTKMPEQIGHLEKVYLRVDVKTSAVRQKREYFLEIKNKTKTQSIKSRWKFNVYAKSKHYNNC